jgi:hypothetical protein
MKHDQAEGNADAAGQAIEGNRRGRKRAAQPFACGGATWPRIVGRVVGRSWPGEGALRFRFAPPRLPPARFGPCA